MLRHGPRGAAFPIVHTNVRYQPGGRDGGVFFRKVPALACFEAGPTRSSRASPTASSPPPGETVITKQYASAFFGTSLASTLTALGVDTLLIAGVQHQRLRARHGGRRLPAWLHPVWSSAKPSATATPRRTRPTCSTCRPSTPRS